jgi:hypothetical protein
MKRASARAGIRISIDLFSPVSGFVGIYCISRPRL